MEYFHTLLFKPYKKILENEYNKFIIESKFKTSFDRVIKYSYLISFVIVSLTIALGRTLNNNEVIAFGFALLLLNPLLIQKILLYLISIEIKQFDLDSIFILKELVLIASSTNSESQAYYLLSTNPNRIVQNLGKNFFIERNITTISTTDPIINQLDKIQNSKITPYLKKIFSEWSIKGFFIRKYAENFQNVVQRELEEDYQNLETNITIINSLIGLLPILIVFLIFVGFKIIHPLFELTLILFFGILLLIILLDPLRVEPVNAFFGSSTDIKPISGTKLLQEFSTLLTLNQNYGKSLYQLMLSQIKNKETSNDNFVININFSDYSKINSELIDIITMNKGSKLKNLFKTIHELERIDFQQMVAQLPQFIDNYSSIEQYYQKKNILLKTENRKTFFIILLNSLSLGILSSILPFLFYINSFNLSIIKNNSKTFLMAPTLELVIPLEFLILVIILYSIYYKVYVINSLKVFLRSLFIILTLFSIGFFFCLFLLKPTIVIF